MKKIHYMRSDSILNETFCGKKLIDEIKTTTDPQYVTCKNCLRRLKRITKQATGREV